jgi:hypothetical protein
VVGQVVDDRVALTDVEQVGEVDVEAVSLPLTAQGL